jgi:hypothetical protein
MMTLALQLVRHGMATFQPRELGAVLERLPGFVYTMLLFN